MNRKLVMAFCALIILALVPLSISAGQNISSWSIDVKKSSSGLVVESRSDVYGSRKVRRTKLGNYSKVTRFERFEMGVIPLTPKNDSADLLHSCLSEINVDGFIKAMERLTLLANVVTIAEEVKFTMLAVPEGTTIHFKEKTPISKTIEIRLVYPQPSDPVHCQQSWEKFLAIAIHEYIHVYILLAGIDCPNLLSNEVAVHSVTSCARLAYEAPSKVFPGWSDIEVGSIDFQSMYLRILDGSQIDFGRLGKRPTLVGEPFLIFI